MEINNQYSQFDWIKQHHTGILEIYPTKCGNELVLQRVLRKLSNEGYELVQIFNDYIRAFKRN